MVSCGTEQIEGRSEGVIKIWKFNKNKLELAGLIKSNDAMEWDINRVILTSDEKYIISTCTV